MCFVARDNTIFIDGAVAIWCHTNRPFGLGFRIDFVHYASDAV